MPETARGGGGRSREGPDRAAPPLTGGERALVRVSAALASGDRDALEAALGEAAERASPRELEEALLQSYLFLGYPATLEAFALWRRRPGAPPAGEAEEDGEGWAERGERVCRAVYGSQYGALRRNVRRLHPDLERWMVAEGYGKVLGRPGLDLRRRELCILSILAVLGAERPLHSHLRGALRAGAPPAAVAGALEEALAFADGEAAARARRVWRRVSSRADEGPADP